MKPVKILGSIGAVALLSAASCGPVNPDDKCLTNSVYLPRCDAETIHGASRGR